MEGRFVAPSPRDAVADPKLTRPDWTSGTRRDPQLLWLDKNENTDRVLMEVTRRVVVDVVTQVAPECLSTYPDNGPFYRKLAQHVGIGADHLLLAAGSDGVIRSVFEAFVSTGDRVFHTSPTFAMYPVYSRMYGAAASTIEYEASARGPVLSLPSLIAQVEAVRPKLVCLPNPDSPTGTAFDATELAQIVEAAGKVGALLLIDEAYYPFCETTALPFVLEHEHVVIARTFAKAWGLAGLRIGYAIASPNVAQWLHKVRPMYEVNTLAVAVMERMLDHHDDVLASVRRLNEGRDGMISAMEKLGFRTVHAKGNFMHVAFAGLAPAIHTALKDVVLYRQDHADRCLKGFTRFSATTVDGFQPIIRNIEQIALNANPNLHV